jgi:hypothetical protein
MAVARRTASVIWSGASPRRSPAAVAARTAMFGRRVLAIAALQGLSALAAVLGVYLWTVLTGRPGDVTRSATFAALVIANLALTAEALRDAG